MIQHQQHTLRNFTSGVWRSRMYANFITTSQDREVVCGNTSHIIMYDSLYEKLNELQLFNYYSSNNEKLMHHGSYFLYGLTMLTTRERTSVFLVIIYKRHNNISYS